MLQLSGYDTGNDNGYDSNGYDSYDLSHIRSVGNGQAQLPAEETTVPADPADSDSMYAQKCGTAGDAARELAKRVERLAAELAAVQEEARRLTAIRTGSGHTPRGQQASATASPREGLLFGQQRADTSSQPAERPPARTVSAGPPSYRAARSPGKSSGRSTTAAAPTEMLMDLAARRATRPRYEYAVAEATARTAAPQSAGLPPGWESKVRQSDGRVYYIDHDSKSTSWEPPPGVSQQRGPPPVTRSASASAHGEEAVAGRQHAHQDGEGPVVGHARRHAPPPLPNKNDKRRKPPAATPSESDGVTSPRGNPAANAARTSPTGPPPRPVAEAQGAGTKPVAAADTKPGPTAEAAALLAVHDANVLRYLAKREGVAGSTVLLRAEGLAARGVTTADMRHRRAQMDRAPAPAPASAPSPPSPPAQLRSASHPASATAKSESLRLELAGKSDAAVAPSRGADEDSTEPGPGQSHPGRAQAKGKGLLKSRTRGSRALLDGDNHKRGCPVKRAGPAAAAPPPGFRPVPSRSEPEPAETPPVDAVVGGGQQRQATSPSRRTPGVRKIRVHSPRTSSRGSSCCGGPVGNGSSPRPNEPTLEQEQANEQVYSRGLVSKEDVNRAWKKTLAGKALCASRPSKSWVRQYERIHVKRGENEVKRATSPARRKK